MEYLLVYFFIEYKKVVEIYFFMEEKNKKNPRILMYGYFGAGNIGDEAILEIQIKILRELNPNIEISILTHNEKRAKELNVKPYDFKDILKIINAIEECDLIISGGGGLFQDISGTCTPLYYGLIMYLGEIIQRPVFIFGQGFGPITTKKGISYTKKLLPFCAKATFRDKESLKEFKEYAPNIPAFYTADPAFAYEVGNSERGIKLLQKLGINMDKKIIYFSIREFKNLDYKIIAEGINKWYNLLQDKNIQIVIIPFQFVFDKDISENISKLLLPENYCFSEVKVSELMDLFAVDNCELIFSTRLHGIILGSISHKCCIAISYAFKVQRICDILEAPFVQLKEINSDKVYDLLNKSWENRKEISEREYNIAMKEKEKVYDTAKMALELLKK